MLNIEILNPYLYFKDVCIFSIVKIPFLKYLYLMELSHKVLTKSFYQKSAKTVALKLLGKTLVYQNELGHYLSGTIVETEAYLGLNDPACHSFGGKKTSRNLNLYQDAGHTYVYFIYGMYHCMNFITGDTKTPEAVLIRAIQPIKGISYMKQNRKILPKNQNLSYLTSGPGKLCQAFGFNLNHNKWDLTQKKSYPSIYVLDTKSISTQQICKTHRIGIQNTGEAAFWPLRFYIKNNSFVSIL